LYKVPSHNIAQKLDNPIQEQDIKCVSVIIPTLNSERTISKCLESIRVQTYKNIEVIVIDGFSSDNTTKIASRFNANIHLLDGERAFAKNFGISKSSGDFLLFVDSDMILQPTVIEDCVRCCSADDRIAGVVIPERSIGFGFWVRVRDFERSFYASSKIESPRFFKKAFVVQVGGFDEDITFYEESTVHQKLENIGIKVDVRITSFILHNEIDFNLTKWLWKKHYYSTNMECYYNRYKSYARFQTSISYRIKLFLSNGNWKRLFRHPILTVGVITLKGLELFISKIK
jgi:glycosyltransferase involved in cell wall biosynthesis